MEGTTAVVVIGGLAPDRRLSSILVRPTIVVAADAGLHHAIDLGLRVNAVVGDMDSVDHAILTGAELNGVEVVRSPRDKDLTDTELALRHAASRGATRITVVTGGGGRLDHQLGVIASLAHRDLALACVLAYNDWMVDEWCGDSGGRLIPLPIVPLWDAELAAAEVRRNAARGAHAVCFSEIPPKLGLPSIHSGAWDPFFEACQETKTVVCMHIGSSSRMPSTSSDAPAAVQATLSFGNAMSSMTDFLFSGVLVRYPELKLAYSEGQIGWVPYILERADDVWHEHRAWAGVKDIVPEPPSTYYYRQIYTCFFRDRHGIDSIDKVGVDNVTFETDYPHTDSTWPNTKEVAIDLMGHLSPELQYKIMRGNAIRMLDLDIV